VSTTKWKQKVDTIIAQRGKIQASLLPCLEIIQETDRYISPEAIGYLRETLNITAADIYGVLSFYGMLTIKAQGKYVIRLCNSLPCNISKSENMIKVVENELGIKSGETTRDKKFTLEIVACLGLCDQAPIMMINEKEYGNLTATKVKKIIAGLKG
jgi:NADH-quinone oxidoreductase subunit E